MAPGVNLFTTWAPGGMRSLLCPDHEAHMWEVGLKQTPEWALLVHSLPDWTVGSRCQQTDGQLVVR